MPQVLTVAAVRILDGSGRILLVRKHGTSMFMQPGGKLEPGESPAAAACRELAEELGVDVTLADLVPMGVWSGPAANEADTRLDAHLFATRLSQVPRAAAELAEIAWVDPTEALVRPDVAPLLRRHVLPDLLGTPA